MSINFRDINFYIKTFGCQMNKHDSERICGLLESLGATSVDNIDKSDIAIYMTCCVREAADVRLYGQAASIKNVALRDDSPLNKRIVAVGGCVGQRDGDKLLKIVKNVDVVFGTHNIASLPSLLSEAIQDNKSVVEILDKSNSFPTDLPTHREKAWAAWLPITIGCNNFCSYCIVPYVRGREKSRPMDDIINEAKTYVEQGVSEITLLGQNVNSYGRDIYGKPKFYDLLCRVHETGIQRLRFATSHPKDITDEVIYAFGQLERLMPSLHLPVQSGSDKILKEMNRRYTSAHYLELIEKLRASRHDIALSTDIIVGFPGESENDFIDTYNLVKKVGYHQVFSFIYSKREGTPAASIVDNTPREVIQNRFNRLLDVISENAYKLNQEELDKTIDVLFEGVSKKDNSILVGKSPKNQTVHTQIPKSCSDPHRLIGHIVPVHINKCKTWYLLGDICECAI